MISFWGLIPRSLLKHKAKALLSGSGIMLSMCLIVSVSIMVDTLKKSSFVSTINDSGGMYDASFTIHNKKDYDKLSSDPLVGKATLSSRLGMYTLPNGKGTLEIKGFDEDITEFLNFKLIQGRYPEKDNEIAIEQWVLDMLPKKYKIGDKIDLPSTIEYPNAKGGTEKFSVDNDFVLVGTYSYVFNTYGLKNRGSAYTTREYVEAKIPPELCSYEGFLLIDSKKPAERSVQLLSMSYNSEKILVKMNFIKMFTLRSFKTLDKIIIILYIVLAVTAGIIIYNIFNISTMERMKEFGMLRALGATPSNIRMLVLGEGIIIGLLFIPLGIVTGSTVIKGIIALVSGYKEFDSIFDIPTNGIIACFIVGLLSIALGVYTPSKRASKISAMEAINSNNNLFLKGSKLRNNIQNEGIMFKLFGFTGVMALMNLKRNKKRFVTTVISLSISIIVFMFVHYLINSSQPLSNFKERFGGDFIINASSSNSDYSISNEDLSRIKSLDGIRSIDATKNTISDMRVPDNKVTEEGLQFQKKQTRLSPEARSNYENKIYEFKTEVLGVSNVELNKMKESFVQGKVDVNEMQDKPIAILAQNLNYTENTSLGVGDTVEISYNVFNENGLPLGSKKQSFTIGSLLSTDFTSSDMQVHNVVIISDAAAEKFLKLKGYQRVKVVIEKSADHAKVQKLLNTALKDNRGIEIKSWRDAYEAAKAKNLQITLIMYSLVLAVAIISIINLFNTMSMNILLRKNETGILRALGFGNDEVRKMLTVEGGLYGLSASLIGTFLGTWLSYLFYIPARVSLMQGMTWSFPSVSILITFFTVSLLSVTACRTGARKIFSAGAVDSIRAVE